MPAGGCMSQAPGGTWGLILRVLARSASVRISQAWDWFRPVARRCLRMG